MITIQDAIQAMKEYQAQDDVSDEEMVGILYSMFQADKLSLNEFGAMLDGLGYELSEEFLNMSPEDQKTKLYEEEDNGNEAAEGVSQEEVEDAKEYGDGQTNDGDDANKKEEEKEENPFKKDNNPQNGNDEERKEARKLYGFDK